MESLTEDSDEDCVDDPITLIDCEQKRINEINIQESILISDSDMDVDTVPSPQLSKSAIPPKYARASSCKIVNSNLPEAFRKKSRNFELLNKCLPLGVKVVDCINHSWYYRKKYKNIKFEESVNKLRAINKKNKREYQISVEGRNSKDTMKLKIRAVDIETYLKSPIRDMKTAQCRQNNDEGVLKKGNDEKTVQFKNIDFKKNRGLVGLKIVYDGNITDSNPICEGNKQSNEAIIPKCDSQNTENEGVGTISSPKNSLKKRNIEESPQLIDSSRPLHLKNNKHGEKSFTSNSESLKFTNGSKAAEEKHYHDKRSSQTHEQKAKPKTPGKKQKTLKETKEVENAKMNKKKHANVKKTKKLKVQKNEVKAIHGKNRMAENVSKSKVVLGHTLDILLNSENNLKISVDDNIPLSDIAKDKVKSGKHKITKPIQENIVKRCEQRQNNPKNNAIGQTMDITEAVTKNKISLKMNVEYNVPVGNLTKSEVKLVNQKATKKLKQNNDRRCEQEIISKKIEKCTGKNLGQNVHKSSNIKTESKFVSLNEGNTNKNMRINTSHKRNPMSPIVANSQLNDKLAFKTPDLSKQEKNCEFQQKPALSIQNLSIGKLQHLQIERALAPTKSVVICPVSNINTVAENSRSTSSPAAQEKRSVCNEKLMSSHNGLQITVPTSVHQMLPYSNQSQIRYQVSPNVPMSTVLSMSFSRPSQNLKLIPTPLPISKTPSILSHARFIIKRPNSEPVSNPGQHNCQNNSTPNKTLNSIPTLTSTSKGRYLLINKKIIDSSKVPEQQTDSISCNFEQHHLHTMPIQHNKVIQNQTLSQYSMPDMSSNTNNLASKEKSTKKRPVLNSPTLLLNLNSSRHEHSSTQYPNLQLQQPTVATQNHNNLRVQLPYLPPLPNLYLSNYVQNPPLITDQTQNCSDQSQLSKNMMPLFSQQPKQNGNRSFFNNDAMLKTVPSAKTEHPALPTGQNNHESYYNHSSCQATAYQQQNLYEHASWSHQNTITNLDTNALTHPPPLYDSGSQKMDDMEYAYWNDVNYLGDGWQEGYPQPAESQQLAPVFKNPPGLPQFQHPPPLPVSLYSSVPSDLQYPPPLPISTYNPPPSSVPQQSQPPSSVPQQSQPPSVAQNPMSSAALEYPPPTPVTQHPPPVVTQHPPPPLSHQHPPLPTISTQGCTILGANNNGVVRTINLVTSTTTGPALATLNNSLIAENNNPENSKTGMLKELSKKTGVKSQNLKIFMCDSHSKLKKNINRKPSGPLAKVKKIEGFATGSSSSQKSLNYGYSPPILPIFTYEKSLEYIAQASKALDTYNGEKSDLDGWEDRALIKNSIDEYKNRSQEEKVEDTQAEIKSESKLDATDLGYDSDSTVILV